MAEKADDDSIAFMDGGDNDSIYKEEEEEEHGGEDVMLAKKLDKLSLKKKPSPMRSHILRNTSTKTPTGTPIKKKYPIPPMPPRSISDLVDYPPSQTSINYKDIFE
eukprot:13434205-Ditylum_brightwellii.AAC.1